MYIVHMRIYGGLLNLLANTQHLSRTLMYSHSETRWYKSILLTHSTSIANRTCVLNNKRTMSTLSKPEPIRVYINSDAEKESIINENK